MRRAAALSLVAAGICAAAGMIALAMFAASRPALTTTERADLAFRPNAGARLPLAAGFLDERGQTVALGDFFSKSPVIVVLEYLRCRSLCGVTLHNLIADALNPLPLVAGRDFKLVAISIDPRDTPADAAAAQEKYAALYDRGEGAPGLHFLTGSATAAREVADAIGFPYRYDAVIDEYVHPAGFIIAAPDGAISRYVEGVAISPDDLVAALADAQQSKVQSPLTRLLLLCGLQGAAAGRWTGPVMAAFTLANIAGGLVLLALFAGIHRRRHG